MRVQESEEGQNQRRDTRKGGTRRAKAKGKHTRMRRWMQSTEEKDMKKEMEDGVRAAEGWR